MTRDEILNMPAGADIDELIERNVFGWTPKTIDEQYRVYFKPYSTDIAAAWEVVEKQNVFQVIKSGDYWLCMYHNGLGMDSVGADTAPLAICRAALLATLGGE